MLQIYKIIFKCMYYLVKDTLEYTGCLKIREFRIQSVVGKDPVKLEKYLEKKICSFWRRYKHFNFVQYIAAFISQWQNTILATLPFHF
jgi:hypothetical protein